MRVRPQDEIDVDTQQFQAAEGVPNHPSLPLVLMHRVLDAASPSELERLLSANGWGGMWQWSVFPYHHYHPNAHEMLACVAGSAEIMLGGPAGMRFTVTAGDVLVLPAGMGHCRLESDANFSVCGAYPHGQEDYETCRAEDLPLDEAAARIARVALPAADPLYGADGPLVAAWGLRR